MIGSTRHPCWPVVPGVRPLLYGRKQCTVHPVASCLPPHQRKKKERNQLKSTVSLPGERSKTNSLLCDNEDDTKLLTIKVLSLLDIFGTGHLLVLFFKKKSAVFQSFQKKKKKGMPQRGAELMVHTQSNHQ